MTASANLNDLDVFFLCIPLILFLVVGYFRLDKFLVPSKAARTTRPVFHPVSEQEMSAMYSDPDGRPWDQP